MSVRKLIAGLLFSGISLLALSGCAVGPENNNPTQLTSQWVDPAATFEQKTITGLLVAAVVENPTNRRISRTSHAMSWHCTASRAHRVTALFLRPRI